MPGSQATRPLRARTGSTFRLDADSIIDGVADPLLAAKVSFGCLHRYMGQAEIGSGLVRHRPGGRAGHKFAVDLWGEFLDAGFSRTLPDHVPDDLLAGPLSHTVPARVTLRKILPLEIPADCSQSSMRCLTQSGTGI